MKPLKTCFPALLILTLFARPSAANGINIGDTIYGCLTWQVSGPCTPTASTVSMFASNPATVSDPGIEFSDPTFGFGSGAWADFGPNNTLTISFGPGYFGIIATEFTFINASMVGAFSGITLLSNTVGQYGNPGTPAVDLTGLYTVNGNMIRVVIPYQANYGIYNNNLVTSAVFQLETVPEPGTLGLFGLGLAAIAMTLRRRRR